MWHLISSGNKSVASSQVKWQSGQDMLSRRVLTPCPIHFNHCKTSHSAQQNDVQASFGALVTAPSEAVCMGRNLFVPE